MSRDTALCCCRPHLQYLFEISVGFLVCFVARFVNLLKTAGHVMHQQFNVQQLYLCVLCLSENKQRLVPLTAYTDWFL